MSLDLVYVKISSTVLLCFATTVSITLCFTGEESVWWKGSIRMFRNHLIISSIRNTFQFSIIIGYIFYFQRRRGWCWQTTSQWSFGKFNDWIIRKCKWRRKLLIIYVSFIVAFTCNFMILKMVDPLERCMAVWTGFWCLWCMLFNMFF